MDDVQRCLVCGSCRWLPTGLTNAYGRGADVVECQDCGVRFYSRELYPVADSFDTPAHEALAADTLAGGALNNRDPDLAEHYRAWHNSLYDSLLSELAVHVLPLAALYEVGTHVGFLLERALARGLRVGGCDVDAPAARYAASITGADIEPRCFQAATPGGGWDAVAMLDVIEHTPTPVQDLERAHAILRPGGVLLLKTFYEEWHDGMALDLSNGNLGCADNLKARGYYGIGHRCHWTTGGLIKLLERCGFRIPLAVRHEPIHGQVTLLYRKRA